LIWRDRDERVSLRQVRVCSVTLSCSSCENIHAGTHSREHQTWAGTHTHTHT
jgi:hypothetical protein